MTKTDRRVERTRELLQKALIELIREQSYEAITIQDIVDRANVGRTTFYLHYTSKDDLFMGCHEAIVRSSRAPQAPSKTAPRLSPSCDRDSAFP